MAIIKTKFSRGVEGTTNIVDAGTEGTKVASGTTAQRGSTAGQIRFNSTNNLAEYYNGTSFKQIDSPPTVSSIDVTEVDSQAGGNQTIVITGSGFASGATVTFVGASGTNFNASTVTVDSLTQITAVAPKASFLNAQEPYGVKVTNVSGLSNTLASQINVDTAPSWSTSSGSLGSFNNYSTINVSATATDSDGDTVSYSVQSGSIPAGLSLNSSTGAITGTPTAVTNSTTSSFTLRATAGSKIVDRQFSIVITNAVVQTFNYTGSDQTWTVPSGWTITSGQGTNSITATVGSTNGSITCTPSTTCSGNGTARSLSTTIPDYRVAYSNISFGSSTWCSGASRDVTIDVKNTGIKTWNSDYTTNLAVAWVNGTNGWSDYHVRTSTGSLAPGSTQNYTLTIEGKYATSGPVYGSNNTGTYNLQFSVVNENYCWFHSSPCGSSSVATSSTITFGDPGSVAVSDGGSTICENANLTGTLKG